MHLYYFMEMRVCSCFCAMKTNSRLNDANDRFMKLRPCAHESGSVRLRSQISMDRPAVHTGSNLSEPVWLRYRYQRGTDKKNGAVWLRSIRLPCEPTDRIKKMVQIGNEANFVYKRGLSTFSIF